MGITAFHPGELQAQGLAGTSGMAQENGVSLREYIPESAKLFINHTDFVAVSSVDAASQEVWVSPAITHGHGSGGPIVRPVIIDSAKQLVIRTESLIPDDILRSNMDQDDAPLGFVAIDFMQRARYRTNGFVNHTSSDFGNHEEKSKFVSVRVTEAFPNCPKYIQRRVVDPLLCQDYQYKFESQVQQYSKLTPLHASLINKSDTLFLGTYHSNTGADANHRGGNPGFVQVVSSTQLQWEDYRGNGMFQSHGNLFLNPKAGLLFVDFELGSILQLTGAAVVKDEPNRRIIQFDIQKVRWYSEGMLGTRWKFVEMSPYNPVLSNGHNNQESKFPMRVKLTRIVNESSNVKTFRFVTPIPVQFLPGQYATFQFDRVTRYDDDSIMENVVRTWTISETAASLNGDTFVEISVKRKDNGLVSRYLHDYVHTGFDGIHLLGIDGDMSPIIPKEPPAHGLMAPPKVIIVTAGIGITVGASILRGLRGLGFPDTEILFIHTSRTTAEIPFANELLRRGTKDPCLKFQLLVTGESIESSNPFEPFVVKSQRRLDEMLIKELVQEFASRNTHAYVVGPGSFDRGVSEALVANGILADHVHVEHFNF